MPWGTLIRPRWIFEGLAADSGLPAERQCYRGRIAKVLRNEARLVADLLGQDWPVVERVAQAAIEMGILDEAVLRRLIEGPGDIVRVWESNT